MSPTSCRCSTPRQGRHPPSQQVRGVRGGLASRGVAPTVLSGAALGHDRVRDGSGWVQRALGHGCPSPAIRRRETPCSCTLHVAPRGCSTQASALPVHPRALHGHYPVKLAPGSECLLLARAALTRTRSLVGEPGLAWNRVWKRRPRPLGRLSSSRLPAVHLPPINPVICRGPYLLSQWGVTS